MKHITFVGAGLSSGGAEHQCVILMNMLVEHGYKVSYVSIGEVEDHYVTSPLIERVSIKPGSKGLFCKLLYLQKYLLSVKTDVVIAFSQRMSVISIPALIFRNQIKLISSERNYTEGRADIFEKILLKWQFYRRSNVIISNNYSQRDYLAKQYKFIRNKIKVITNYTDLGFYLPSPLPSNRIIKIGIFCRIEKQKNVLMILDALNVLKNKLFLDFKLDWYGNHKFTANAQIEYYNEAMRKIDLYGLQTNITIHDPTKNVDKLLRKFDCLCLPSLHEGFSNSLAEYICCGRPVLCSDVSDNHLMVRDGINGFLFNPNEISSIVNAFQKFFSLSNEEKREMCIASRNIATELFNKKTFIDSYINFIEN